MAIFTNETMLRFFQQGEDHLSHDRPYLVDRYSLDIKASQSTYILPDYVQSIRRITWMGHKIWPLPKRDHREVFQSATQTGRPFWYIYNNIGLNKLELFPIPAIDLAQATTGLWDTAIPTSCIVEFYRVTDNNIFVAPAYLRRQLLKQYVAKQCFAIEGPGQNIKMSQYFARRWELKKAEFYKFLEEVHDTPRKLVCSDIVGSNYFPASPLLPIAKYGIAVDEGD